MLSYVLRPEISEPGNFINCALEFRPRAIAAIRSSADVPVVRQISGSLGYSRLHSTTIAKTDKLVSFPLQTTHYLRSSRARHRKRLSPYTLQTEHIPLDIFGDYAHPRHTRLAGLVCEGQSIYLQAQTPYIDVVE